MSTFVVLDMPVEALMQSRAYQRDLYIVLNESHQELWDRWHISHNFGELRKYARSFLRNEFTTDLPDRLLSVVEGYPNVWEDNMRDGRKAGGGEHSQYCLLKADPNHLYYFERWRYGGKERLRYVRKEDIVRLNITWERDGNGPFEFPLKRIRLLKGACEQVLNMHTGKWEDDAFRGVAVDGKYHESYRAFGTWRRFNAFWTRFPVVAARLHAYVLYPLDENFFSHVYWRMRLRYHRLFPDRHPVMRFLFPNSGNASDNVISRRQFLGLE